MFSNFFKSNAQLNSDNAAFTLKFISTLGTFDLVFTFNFADDFIISIEPYLFSLHLKDTTELFSLPDKIAYPILSSVFKYPTNFKH